MRVRPVLAVATAVLLALLASMTYDAAPDWPVALGCWAGWLWWVDRNAPEEGVGPADLVTLFRGSLSCLAAGLVVASGAPDLVFWVCVAALLLDAVDGQVARRTGTTSAFGGRFDGETDAFLMLVLSVHAATTVGGWVLVLGLLRYAFWVAGELLPWLARPLPYRWWRKVATAVAGGALVAAVPGLLPLPVVTAGLLVALALLLESFGRDVWWSWHRHAGRPVAAVVGP